MTITMNDDNLTSAVQLFDIVKAGMAIRFAAEDRAKTYAWIETALGKFRYQWAVVRKWMGHGHIPKRYATTINRFYERFLNPYLNLHRHSAYPTEYTDVKGKTKKKYETYLTPCQKLLTLPDVEAYLRLGVTTKSLSEDAMRLSHLDAAHQVQIEKHKLFNAIVR